MVVCTPKWLDLIFMMLLYSSFNLNIYVIYVYMNTLDVYALKKTCLS